VGTRYADGAEESYEYGELGLRRGSRGAWTNFRLTELATHNTLRRVKKLLVCLVAFAAVLGTIGAIVKLTVPSRAEAARERLTLVAERFVQCYSRDASYERCETGTEKLMVGERSKRRFELVSAVELGPIYSISGTPSGRLERSCQPTSTYCPHGQWPSE